jgi:hypothetical protein
MGRRLAVQRDRRPIAKGTVLIQLDDLAADMMDRLRPVAFLCLKTPPATSRHGLPWPPPRPVTTCAVDEPITSVAWMAHWPRGPDWA